MPSMPPIAKMRRSVIIALGIALLGCASAPPPPAPPPPAPLPQAVPIEKTREVRLLELGFVRADEGWLLNLGAPLLFEQDADTLSATAQATISQLANTFRSVDIAQLKIFGHTDSTGPPAYNLALSLRRATAVANAFVTLGFSEGKIERRGLGHVAPVASNETPEGRQQNRRVVVIVPFD
jgi:outer membrane protein OmpA-like peptidoglycan-associated protein